MICPPLPPAPLVSDWVERHRDPRSLVLHLVGIPVSVLGLLLVPVYLALFSAKMFLFATALFVIGYLLQFLGHLLEWSMPGELAAIGRWLGKRRHSATGQPEA